MSRVHKPGHAVVSGGRTFYVTSTGDYVEHDDAKYQRARERSRWARNGRPRDDEREMVP